MCGIVCVYGNKEDKSSRRTLIKNMISVLQHRGPDGWGYYNSPDILMGQTRLSIVDLAGGSQPMAIHDHIIIFNGEIFNHIELRKELHEAGVQFTSNSDTEVLLRCYLYYGVQCFEKFNGQFACIIWNRKTKELIAARDRFGIRPFYYTKFNDQYYFGSEMKAFDKIKGFSRNFNAKNLFQHGLIWNTTDNNTVYNDIYSLPGGSYLIMKNGTIIKSERYYDLGLKPVATGNSYEDCEKEFKELLNDSVKLRLRSDVPVGAYLSGGIDSSVILHLISQHTSNSYKSFSVTFADKEFDESEYQQEMVKLLNTEHHKAEISYQDIDTEFINAIYHTERPVFRTAPVPLYLLSKVVQQNNIKVVLTGEGADEILWGYDAFKEVKLLEFWNRYPDSAIRPLLIKKLYPHLNHYANEEQFGMMKMFYEGFLGESNNVLASLNIRMHNNQILLNYLDKSHDIRFNKDEFISEYSKNLPSHFKNFNPLKKSQYQEMRSLLSGYLLSSQGDRMSMAHSVEGRYPFLDHRVVDYAFNMNDQYKLKGFEQKYMLKKAYQNSIPQSILNRPKRPYMAPDLKSFFPNGNISENSYYFLNETLIKEYGIFNYKWVERFINKFKDQTIENIGYRDNMIITFILSTQIAQYWAKNPRIYHLSEDLKTVEIDDY